MENIEKRSAFMTWHKRWAGAEEVSHIYQDDSAEKAILFTNFMGCCMMDMDDIPEVVKQLRGSADSLERTYDSYQSVIGEIYGSSDSDSSEAPTSEL